MIPRAPWLVFAAALILYIGSSYPTIAPRDSPDLANAALAASVAHPPGYPLYALLGKAWMKVLPIGNPAYRLNVLSAVCGALAAAVLCALLAPWTGFVPALAGCLIFALSAPLWKFSLLQEMYSLAALLAAALLWLSQGQPRTAARRFYASALLYGLALVNHQTAILLAPALAFLWRAEIRKGQHLSGALAFFALGLSLYAFVWIRLGGARLAWEILTRAEYGSLTLSAPLSRDFSAPTAAGLLVYLFTGLGGATSWIALGLGAAGAVDLWERARERAWVLALIFTAFGPLFFLLTRFDASGWIARSVLEPAFLMPCLIVAVAAAAGAARLFGGAPALAAALVLTGASLWARGAQMCHRDDFSAYDYAKDLRRFVAPGAAAIVAGDTAQFSLKYLDLTQGAGPRPRAWIGSLEPGLRPWLDETLKKTPVYVVGLATEAFEPLGVNGTPYHLNPQGPAARVVAGRPAASGALWELSVRRTPRAAESGESYARDVLVSYAAAHYLTGSIAEARGAGEALVGPQYRKAGWLDPENYRVSFISAKDSQ